MRIPLGVKGEMYVMSIIQFRLSWCSSIEENGGAFEVQGNADLFGCDRQHVAAPERVVVNVDTAVTQLVRINQRVMQFVSEPKRHVDNQYIYA